jgi:hypothetical protein
MKAVLAALLLLVQLQPLAGTALCLAFADRASQKECEMPEHGAVPHSTLAQADSSSSSCALASVCTPSPLAVPSLIEEVVTTTALPPEVAITHPAILANVFSAPPFHPPKA